MKKLILVFVLIALLGGCTVSGPMDKNFWFANTAVTNITIINNTTCMLEVFDVTNRDDRDVVRPKGSTLVTYELLVSHKHSHRYEMTVIVEAYVDGVFVTTKAKKFKLNNQKGSKAYLWTIGGENKDSLWRKKCH